MEYTSERLWEEVERIDSERGRRTLGQELFFLCGYFASPFFFYDPDTESTLDDYRMSAALGVPLALTLDTLPAFRSEDFVVIAEELAAIRRYLAAQKRG